MAKQREDDLISVAEAAKLIGVTSNRVRDFIKGERLSATRIGRTYVLRRGHVTNFERREPGRPAKGGN